MTSNNSNNKKGKRKMKISRLQLYLFNHFKRMNELISAAVNNNNEEEKIYVLLKLNKNIAQLLRIFANVHADEGIGTENKRIDNLSREVTKIIEALASDSSGPAQEPFPDSLKQHVKNLLLNEAATTNNNNNNKDMEDLK